VRVLLVEDEAAIADALQRGLNAEGFVTECAPNGVDGLWLATENEFDVVIRGVPEVAGLWLDRADPHADGKRRRV
jgi:DNA-binding response OmpR family regulator